MKNRKKMILTVSLLTALALFAGCSTAAAVSPETIPAVTAAPVFLDLGQVKAIAYDHAGVAESAATDRSYDFDDGRYEIEFDHGGWEYDYHIAPDGTILRVEKTPEPTRPAETRPVETQPVETKPVETKPATSTRITSEEARTIAYAHAGVKESDAYDRSWERDDGRYEIEFSHDGWDYDYTVSYEGKVLRSHREPDDDRPKTTKPAETQPAEQKPAETQPKSGRISAEKALSIALSHAGVTDVRDKDVEWDDGRWEVSFDSGRTEYDYKISADGTILRWEKENDD
ncbi:MAG: PepSY domain-containing protein [Oscillospiraceae bacterium]|nr:PepSY domain-containing protein [Oscillospiraceae bacterium]